MKKKIKGTHKEAAAIGGTASGKTIVHRTKVSAMQCLKCGDIIYSCARHDFRCCSCKAIFIDGGFDYVRGGGNPSEFKSMIKYIPASKEELYDDWNRSNTKPRKYGCIKPASSWVSPLPSSQLEQSSSSKEKVTKSKPKSRGSSNQDS